MGLLAGFFRGWVDTVVSRLTEMVMVFPALLFIIAVRVTAGDTLNAITFGGLLVPGVFTLTLIFAVLRLVLSRPHRPRCRAVAAREGVRRGGTDDRCR